MLAGVMWSLNEHRDYSGNIGVLLGSSHFDHPLALVLDFLVGVWASNGSGLGGVFLSNIAG